MKSTYRFDQAIIRNLVEQAEEKEPSGRLSASRLTWPTQWQILWTLKVPPDKEEYLERPDKINTLHLRHFARGKQCEEWLERVLPPMKSQVECSYRGWVGFADRIDSGDIFNVESDVPHEIKSVKADKWHMMFKEKEGPQYDHVLQANFYAIALELPYFALTYLKSDTLESRSFLYEAADYKQDIDKIIDEYDAAMKSGTIPKFKARVEYQKKAKYNMYSTWCDLKEEELKEAYDRLTRKTEG